MTSAALGPLCGEMKKVNICSSLKELTKTNATTENDDDATTTVKCHCPQQVSSDSGSVQ